MTKKDLKKILSKYKHTDKKYYQLLTRLMFFCAEDFYTILKSAELQNQKVYLKIDHQAEAEKTGIYTDGTIYLEDIGIE